MKVLILRFSSIGDIVLTSPVIRCLKKQLPDIHLHFCTKPEYKDILTANPYIDKIYTLEGGMMKLARDLRKEKFDWVIDLHHNIRTLKLKLLLGRSSRSFSKLNIEKFLYVNFKIDKLPNIHIVDRYLQTVEHLGIKNDGEGLDFFIPHKDEVELEWLPDTHKKGYVAVAIGAQHYTKRLPDEKLIELCDKINKPILLLGGKEDASRGEKIAQFFNKNSESAPFEEGLVELNKKSIVYNACGKFSFNQSASLIRGASFVFTHDTGLMHVASAFKKHIFSIWGNTTPKFGMYPYKTKFVVFENNSISCRPCSKIGYHQCPKGHFKCMRNQIFDFYLT